METEFLLHRFYVYRLLPCDQLAGVHCLATGRHPHEAMLRASTPLHPSAENPSVYS